MHPSPPRLPPLPVYAQAEGKRRGSASAHKQSVAFPGAMLTVVMAAPIHPRLSVHELQRLHFQSSCLRQLESNRGNEPQPPCRFKSEAKRIRGGRNNNNDASETNISCCCDMAEIGPVCHAQG
ncbi:hypothetical protein Q8A73_011437 [Channa argus]|nr:hypothetical protein Q8A73_011437 [Channa argus]